MNKWNAIMVKMKVISVIQGIIEPLAMRRMYVDKISLNRRQYNGNRKRNEE